MTRGTPKWMILLVLPLFISCSETGGPEPGNPDCLISEIHDLSNDVAEINTFTIKGERLIKWATHLETSYLKDFYSDFLYHDSILYKVVEHIDRSLLPASDIPDSIVTLVFYDVEADTMMYYQIEYLYGEVYRQDPAHTFIITKDQIIERTNGVTEIYYTRDEKGNILYVSATPNPEDDPYNYRFSFDDHPSPFVSFPVTVKLLYMTNLLSWGWTNNVIDYQFNYKYDPIISGRNVWHYNTAGQPVNSANWRYIYGNCPQ